MAMARQHSLLEVLFGRLDAGSSSSAASTADAGESPPSQASQPLQPPPPPFLLLVLNHRLPSCYAELHRRAGVVVAADGGANRLFHLSRAQCAPVPPAAQPPAAAVSSDGSESAAALATGLATGSPPQASPASPASALLPDFVVGDMDSIEDEVLAACRAAGVGIVNLEHDQDSTDMQKCLMQALRIDCHQRRLPGETAVSAAVAAQHITTVVVVGGMDGRLDHTLQNLNTMLMFSAGDGTTQHQDASSSPPPPPRIIMYSDSSVATVLPAGDHVLPVQRAWEGPTCGLVPLGSPARATTTGLVWNLAPSMELAWGGLLSTSNKLAADMVTVSTNSPLLWTMACNYNQPGEYH